MTDSREFSPSSDRPAPRRARGAVARATGRRGAGFSLIEVVVVVMILAVVAAIAIPRLSRGGQGTAEAAMARDTQVMQKALDLYAADHNGAFPPAATVTHQLTQYSDAKGVVSSTRTPPYEFGPYLRKIPAVAAGPHKGSTGIATEPAPGVGWVYDPAEGTITANTTPVAAASAPASEPVN